MINNEPNNRSGSSAGDLLHDNTNQYSIDYFADEIFINILSYLNLAQINNLSLVNKKWKRLTRDPNLLKIAIYREIAFGMDKWVQNFGEGMMNNEIEEDGNIDVSSLPVDEFISDCRKFKEIFPTERTLNYLFPLWLPQKFTKNRIGILLKNYFPQNVDGYRSDNALLSGDVPNARSGWVIATKIILPGSRDKSYKKQMKMLDKFAKKGLTGYQHPRQTEALGCILAYYLEERERRAREDVQSQNRYSWLEIWNWREVFTRCVEIDGQDEYTGKDMHVLVGRFNMSGLEIDFEDDDDDLGDEIGMIAIRRFNPETDPENPETA